MDDYLYTVREAAEYLKEYPVFRRMMESFKEKYLSYGRFAGTVVLNELSSVDIEILEGFFQTGFHGRTQVHITAARFQKALTASRFAPALAEDVLQLFFGGSLQGKKQQELERKNRIEALFDRVERFWDGQLAVDWIRDVRYDQSHRIRFLDKDKRFGTGRFVAAGDAAADLQEHNPDQNRFRSALDQTLDRWSQEYEFSEKMTEEEKNVVWTLLLGSVILEELPFRKEKYEYLPVFAARITGDPHYFDQGTPAGTLLYQVAQWMSRHNGEDLISIRLFSSLRRQRIFLRMGILWGDSSNYAMLYGMQAFGKDGQRHQGMEGFTDENDMVQVPLHVIEKWTAVSCLDKRIWIVENPSVYSVLCQQSWGRYTCMCMNGQPKLSSLRILDLLSQSGITVYYAGDFDPEGLLIAQKLKQYYKGTFYYWHMSAEDCRAGLSGVSLSESRIRSLSRITDPLLKPVAEVLRTAGRAGYQEIILERYLQDPLSGVS